MPHIMASNLALTIRQQLTPALQDAVRQLAHERDADYALIRDGTDVLLFLRPRRGRLSFNSGMDTIRRKLLGGPVERVNLPKNPRAYFCKRWPEGLPTHAVVEFAGDYYSPDAIQRAYSATERLIDPDVPLIDLVRKGDITMSEVASISSGRAALKQEQIDMEHKSKPDLEGPHVLTFGRYVNGQREGPPIPVTIFGRPGDLLTKCKHYWIYSSPGHGKSTTARLDLVDKFSAAFVPHAQNAVNVPATAHLLILDEVGPDNRIPITQLKGLSGGNAATSFLNRKSYGQSYVPREDAQFIILGNHSPYEVYANKKKGRMDGMDLQAIEERFHIVRLDGSNADERAKFADVKALTTYEFHEALYKVLYDKNRFLNEQGMLTKFELRDALDESYRMYLDRFAHSEQNLNTRTFLLYLRSLLHESDVRVYEQVHRDYANTKAYVYNTVAVGETIVRVPVMQRPDWHREDENSPDSDDMSHVLSTILRTTPETSPTITCRPPPIPSTHFVHEPDEEDFLANKNAQS
jgi:hypothetical protein